MKLFNVILAILLIMASMLIIQTDVNALRYSMDTDLSNADASFIGEDADDNSGISVAGAGDVNGDGYDDVLIGAYLDDDGGNDAGQTYLILGNATGWAMDIDLSNVDASFIGEDGGDWSGRSVAGVGDVNGDGYDDILIGAWGDDDGGSGAGQTYLILGKASGWAMDADLANADASFIGEDASDRSGYSVAGADDVNGDGYDDILIGAYYDEDGGTYAGQTYLILGKATGWVMDTSLSNADASFIGEDADDRSGYSVASAGDVNGDGYDDILIGAYYDEEGGSGAGQTYLILGNATGWAMDIDLANADASFIGEDANGESGRSVAGAGDVNGDGYDDILIGAYYDDEGAMRAGQTFLILGKATGWAMDIDLANADASFISDMINDYSGWSVAGADDVNGDGYDDILIGAYGDDDGGLSAGQTYLILGKASGWAMDKNLGNVDASFIGEDESDRSGYSVAGAGDVNGDGYDDILIGAYKDEDGGFEAGQTYLIFPDANSKPKSITSVKAYSDDSFSVEVSKADVNDTIYIELQGTDGNSSRSDIAIVNVRSSDSHPIGFNLRLYESGLNTGKYRGNFTIRNRTHGGHRWIMASIGEIITISSIQDPSKNATILLGELVLYPITDDLTAQEDIQYNKQYSTYDISNINWFFETNASWLEWNETSHNVSGTPNNGDVGSYWVRINISMGSSFSDEHNFTLVVKNTPPNITTENIITTVQNQKYSVDYNSSDDGQGIITWHLATNTSSWLQINTISGNLTGIPTNADVGSCWVNVSVDDGNCGWNSTNFTLFVSNANDAPEIFTNDLLTAFEDEGYKVTYEAVDNDTVYGDIITWHMDSNTSFLAMDSASGVLSGTPTNDDVGIYWVNVTVSDLILTSDSHNFTMTVINVNDPPLITSEPIIETIALDPYEYQLNVTDVDIGDILTYSLDTCPDNMVINEDYGLITWIPDPEQIGENPVIVRVGDGNESDTQEFNIKVTTPANYAPWVTLIYPANGFTVNVTNPTLTWSSEDPDSEVIQYDVYLHADQSKIQTVDLISRFSTGQTDDSYMATGLTKGSVYYWTVIPNDGESTGYCSSGIWWFKVSETAALNIAPVITSKPVKSAVVGEQYRYEVLAEDDDQDDVLTYSLIEHPTKMAINTGLGIILWTPSEDQLGKHTVTVKVSDGKSFGIQTFEIEVTLKNNKPVVTIIPEQTIMVGEELSYQVAANDLDTTDILTYRLENAPTGMVINSTGMITWVPNKDQVGKHTITINVSDGKDHTSIEFTVNVKKEDTTSSGFDSTIQASIIIVIIIVIVLLALAMIMVKRKKTQKEKDKVASLGISDQETPQSEMMPPPAAPQTAPVTPVAQQTTQTTMTTVESTILAAPAQATSQLGAAPVPEVTGSQLTQAPQVPQAQPTPQLPPATATEPEPAPIPQPEMSPETIMPTVETPIMGLEPQPTADLPSDTYVQPQVQQPQPQALQPQVQPQHPQNAQPQPQPTSATPTHPIRGQGSQFGGQGLLTPQTPQPTHSQTHTKTPPAQPTQQPPSTQTQHGQYKD